MPGRKVPLDRLLVLNRMRQTIDWRGCDSERGVQETQSSIDSARQSFLQEMDRFHLIAQLSAWGTGGGDFLVKKSSVSIHHMALRVYMTIPTAAFVALKEPMNRKHLQDIGAPESS
ncbi:hypothetical protein CEXT_306641 [Caerostris extrusa]|uniref:Uncharacterized protein n=1 Tax=Caerostris extrusa TaxID=172846 RepID=A0AAV4PQ17_CAEEX|nr:hypothetical protein CEXT_306641 [Caerostris extrusa]